MMTHEFKRKSLRSTRWLWLKRYLILCHIRSGFRFCLDFHHIFFCCQVQYPKSMIHFLFYSASFWWIVYICFSAVKDFLRVVQISFLKWLYILHFWFVPSAHSSFWSYFVDGKTYNWQCIPTFSFYAIFLFLFSILPSFCSLLSGGLWSF